MRAFLGLRQFPEAFLEQGDAVGDLRQQIEAGVADIGGGKSRCVLRQQGEQRGRPAAFGVDETRQHRRSRPGPAEPVEREGPLAALAWLSRSMISAGSPGSAASTARRSGPNGEAGGTPSSSRRAFAGSSVEQGLDDQPHRPERRARRDGGDQRFDLVRGLVQPSAPPAPRAPHWRPRSIRRAPAGRRRLPRAEPDGPGTAPPSARTTGVPGLAPGRRPRCISKPGRAPCGSGPGGPGSESRNSGSLTAPSSAIALPRTISASLNSPLANSALARPT